MTWGCQSHIFSPILIVLVFNLTVSCNGVGLFKLFTAVQKGRGQYPEALSGLVRVVAVPAPKTWIH